MYTEQFIEPFEAENPDVKWADVEVRNSEMGLYVDMYNSVLLVKNTIINPTTTCIVQL